VGRLPETDRREPRARHVLRVPGRGPVGRPAKALEGASYGALHRLGWLGGRLPTKLDEGVKKAGMAGVVFAPRYATVKNAEFFTEKILDATVGDPQRFLVVISPIAIYEQQFRTLWQLMVDYRERYGCFTFLTLYVKSIRSPTSRRATRTTSGGSSSSSTSGSTPTS
jgi:hypothetical protein